MSLVKNIELRLIVGNVICLLLQFSSAKLNLCLNLPEQHYMIFQNNIIFISFNFKGLVCLLLPSFRKSKNFAWKFHITLCLFPYKLLVCNLKRVYILRIYALIYVTLETFHILRFQAILLSVLVSFLRCERMSRCLCLTNL